VTLVLSDVVGDPLEVIASGPTVPDPTTYADAIAVVDAFGLRGQIPQAVLSHLEDGAEGRARETAKQPHPRHEIVLVGSGTVAADAAVESARSRGFAARIATTTLVGEARHAAATAIQAARTPGEVVVFAGETTVTVRGDGRGGRNQEAALAAAIEINGSGYTFLAGGTDGIDGPTTAAGAVVDGTTIDRGRRLGFDPDDSLNRNDAHAFLEATGDLLVTGPTGTNVADVWLAHAGTG
jgi:hydroxypyruvate reductase